MQNLTRAFLWVGKHWVPNLVILDVQCHLNPEKTEQVHPIASLFNPSLASLNCFLYVLCMPYVQHLSPPLCLD